MDEDNGCEKFGHTFDVDGQCVTCGWPESRPRKKAELEAVEHPAHYGEKDSPYEAIKIIEALDLGFNLGNAFKYIARAGKKDPTKIVEDLRKAAFYLNREIENRSKLIKP